MSTTQIIIALIAIAALVYGVYFFAPKQQVPVKQDLPVAPVPPITNHMQKVVAASKGFQALVSYTDKGFEPKALSIHVGDTVRFTNNSSKTMWISSTKGATGLYPRPQKGGCASSAFDTCVALAPHEIWEFTFDRSGDWSYINTSNKSDEGVVSVK